MEEELPASKANQTWEMVFLPPSASIIGRKWMYSIKIKSNGTLDRYKAWLVVEGYKQECGINYLEIFVPVAKMTTERSLLSIVAVRHWPL